MADTFSIQVCLLVLDIDVRGFGLSGADRLEGHLAGLMPDSDVNQ